MAERMNMADLMTRLRAVVAAYGADSGRWPAAERHALAEFVATNSEARRLIADDAAFDAVLAAAATDAPAASVARARDSLLSRLETEGDAAGVPQPGGGRIVPFERRPVPRPAVAPDRSLWREAAVLAAALLIGIFTGTQGLIEGSGLDLTALTSSATSAATDSDDISELALGTAGEGLSEEDLL